MSPLRGGSKLHLLALVTALAIASPGIIAPLSAQNAVAPTAAPLVSAPPAALPLSATPAPGSPPVPGAAPVAPGISPPVPGATDSAIATRAVATSTPEAALPHDLSPWGMFMAADMVVKAVMVGLALASFITWTIWLAKTMELAAARRKASMGLRRIEAAQSLEEATRALDQRWTRRGPAAALLAAATHETDRSIDLDKEGIKERVAIALSRIEARAGRRIGSGTGMLATIGSTAPFVGLFGTVWGIMNAFIGISKTKTTNLAVVAPGIAEALLATAMGLVAAIPAVIIYNVFSRSIAAYRAQLSDVSGEVLQHLSRDLDRREAEAALPREHWAPSPLTLASHHSRPAAE